MKTVFLLPFLVIVSTYVSDLTYPPTLTSSSTTTFSIFIDDFRTLKKKKYIRFNQLFLKQARQSGIHSCVHCCWMRCKPLPQTSSNYNTSSSQFSAVVSQHAVLQVILFYFLFPTTPDTILLHVRVAHCFFSASHQFLFSTGDHFFNNLRPVCIYFHSQSPTLSTKLTNFPFLSC